MKNICNTLKAKKLYEINIKRKINKFSTEVSQMLFLDIKMDGIKFAFYFTIENIKRIKALGKLMILQPFLILKLSNKDVFIYLSRIVLR